MRMVTYMQISGFLISLVGAPVLFSLLCKVLLLISGLHVPQISAFSFEDTSSQLFPLTSLTCNV